MAVSYFLILEMMANQQNKGRDIIHDGRHTLEALSVLQNVIGSSESLHSIAEKAADIVGYSVDPISGPSELPSDGLLYGLIQSGKTSIITVAAAMLADNGFKCIIILTSDINPLYKQTLERIQGTLRGLEVIGKKDWDDPVRFKRKIRTSPFAVVCSKNPNTLKGLLEAFKSVGSMGARGLPTMIIDDEADQASLNTFTSKGVDEISRINELITQFRDFFPVNTYLQVTATPQALFLQRPDHRYRPTFTVLSSPGLGYVGGKAFFGPEDRLLRYVDLEEVEQLRSTHQPSPTAVIPDGLKRALYTFFMAATAKNIQSPAENYAFLCHISHTRIDHGHVVNLIDRFKEETMKALQVSSSNQYQRVIKELQEAYKDISSTQVGLPEIKQIIEKIKFYLPGTKIKLINSSPVGKDETVTLDHVYSIFVGGNKLGRGVTIKNLLISYYGRNPKRPNADTVLQHARMYGYRQDEIGVTRLFLPKKLAEHFRSIHLTESALRDLVEKHPQGKFEGIYISSPLRATRSNVLDPNSIGMYVAGGYCNPIYPLRTADMTEKTEWLDSKLTGYDDSSEYAQVKIDFLIKLIEKCVHDPREGSELWDQKTLTAALEKIRSLRGEKAYLRVRRNRNLNEPRRETQGFLSGGEEALVPKDAPTLFIYRLKKSARGIEVWWPQLRFPEGNYALAFSFNRK